MQLVYCMKIKETRNFWIRQLKPFSTKKNLDTVFGLKCFRTSFLRFDVTGRQKCSDCMENVFWLVDLSEALTMQVVGLSPQHSHV